MKIILITFLLLISTELVFADFKDYINTSVSKLETKEELRNEWNQVLGFDLFAPYFKVKELEQFVRNKCSITLFGFKSELEISNKYNTIIYSFTRRY